MIFDITYLILICISIYLIATLILKYRNSLISIFLIYSFEAIAFLAAIRLLFAFDEWKMIDISETTLMICWHLLFYLSIGIFLMATRALLNVVDVKTQSFSLVKTFLITFLFSSGILLVFLSFTFIDKNISPIMEGSLIDKWGLLHFVAFIFALVASIDLFKIKNKYKGTIGSISGPLIVTLVILSLIHFWELLVESWMIVKVSLEFGESIEGILWIPVFVTIAYGYFRLKKALA